MYRKFYVASIAGLVVAGCGGSGTQNNFPPAGGVTGSTTINTATGTTVSGGGSATPGTVTTTTVTTSSGASETVGIPGATVIPAGASVLLIPNQLPINVVPSSGALLHAPIFKSAAQSRALIPGEIYNVGSGTPVDTGLIVGTNGVISSSSGPSYSAYALPFPVSGGTTMMQYEIAGPLQVTGSTPLDISGGLYFDFELSNNGTLGAGLQHTYPSAANYSLPSDGQSWYGASLQLDLSGLATTTSLPATMVVNSPDGTTRQQTHTAVNGWVTLYKQSDDNTYIVPPTGITSAYLEIPAP